MRRISSSLHALVQSYFQVHLRQIRGASDHTIRAYRDSLRLFFVFVSESRRRPVAGLLVEDLQADVVLAFLEHLEITRGNSSATRNCRLAAIRGLAEHMLRRDPTRADQYRQVLAIPAKRARSRPPCHLEPEEARLLLAQPDTSKPSGTRDRALLLVLYNTGARISEVLGINPEDLHLERPRQVRLHGKGGKDRICPLWAETTEAVRRLLREGPQHDGPIFRNIRGATLTRDGAAHLLAKYVRAATTQLPSLGRRRITPHVLRHSCAVALLQAGVDLTVIRDYLGHVSVATTSRYVSSNLEMKRTALEAFWQHAGLERQTSSRPWRASQGVLAFLDSL